MTYLDGNICTPSNMTPYLKINNNPWQQNSSATVSAGSTVMFGPQPSSGGSWKWSGPQGFSASGREVEISQIREDQAGDYLAVYVNAGGCTTQTTFSLTVEPAVKILAGIRNARPDIVFENRIKNKQQCKWQVVCFRLRSARKTCILQDCYRHEKHTGLISPANG